MKEFTLSNGVKVVVKPTDFSADEIVMTAFRKGGKEGYAKDQATNVLLMNNAMAFSKMGPFDQKTLSKYLAGKKAGVSFSTNNYTDVVSGNSTVKDLPTLMELVYTLFTNVNPDEQTYAVAMQNLRTQLQNADKNPQKVFFDQVPLTMYPENPLMRNVTLQDIDNADYATMLEMGKKALSNAADYTFIFTGNVDEAKLKPMLEQYVATLPASGVTEFKPVTKIEPVRGDVVNEFKKEMESPSTLVYDSYSDYNVPFNMKNYVMLNMMGDILDNIYVTTLREEEGGTYGASVSAGMNPFTGMWNLIYFFQTNKDQQQKLIDRAQAELLKLLNDGASQEEFSKVKEAMLKQLEIQERKNSFWDDVLMSYYRGVDLITDRKAAIESVSLSDLNKFMKGVYNGKNRVQIIMEGEPVK